MPSKKDAWVEISIKASESLADAVSNFMTEIGAQGVYEESPEPLENSDFLKTGADQIIKAHLPQDIRLEHRLASLDAYLESLAALFPDISAPTYSSETVADADWAEGWKKYFKPIRATKNIIIKPTWERYTPVGHDIVIEMDPGMAFGTGQHASTRMCLEALEDVLLHDNAGYLRQVLDVGSGTGILGIAAAKLGASRVLCVDIDRQATDISRENICINHVEDRVEAVTSDVAAIRETFGLIVANLTAKVLIKLRLHIASLLDPGGVLVISGILEQNKEDIERHFFADPFVSIRTLTEKEWLCCVLKKEGLR